MGSCADASKISEAIRRRVVLVVEDEILVRIAVADYLRDADYWVIEAANAAEAVAIFSSGEQVDIVFSDIRMPGPMDGVALARWVADHHPGVPVLLTSANAGPVRSAEFLARDAFLPKPYLLENVASSLRRCLEQEGPHTS
jgi:DNA-binding NtrC family response regulator